jgi:hypothetical protein
MDHAGLAGAALEIEQSREFKKAFEATVTRQLGFDGVDLEILEEREPDAHLEALLESFGPNGYPPEVELRTFLAAELSARARGSIAVGAEVLTICVPTPTGWINIGGYAVLVDGQRLTAEAAVAEYESRHGAIADPAVRAELSAIPVHVQIEWEIPV